MGATRETTLACTSSDFGRSGMATGSLLIELRVESFVEGTDSFGAGISGTNSAFGLADAISMTWTGAGVRFGSSVVVSSGLEDFGGWRSADLVTNSIFAEDVGEAAATGVFTAATMAGAAGMAAAAGGATSRVARTYIQNPAKMISAATAAPPLTKRRLGIFDTEGTFQESMDGEITKAASEEGLATGWNAGAIGTTGAGFITAAGLGAGAGGLVATGLAGVIAGFGTMDSGTVVAGLMTGKSGVVLADAKGGRGRTVVLTAIGRLKRVGSSEGLSRLGSGSASRAASGSGIAARRKSAAGMEGDSSPADSGTAGASGICESGGAGQLGS